MGQVNLLPPDILQRQRYRRMTLTVLAAGAIVLALIVAFFLIQVGRLGSVNDILAALRAAVPGARYGADARLDAPLLPERVDRRA